MSYWLNDPQLFLYAKGIGPDDVLLRRCKTPVSSSSSSLVVPMKSDDFDYVCNVENHLELIGDRFDWDETDYKRLVKYIYERLLLVNGQGLVIAEIYKLDDVNEVPIYIRSLDVLPLKPYIPNIREWPIPLRTVKYLEDVNGKAAMVEENDSNVITKLIARVDDLESKNKTLDTNVTKLTASQVAMTDKVDDLESKNKTLEGKVTKLTADLVTHMNALATIQQELDRMNKEVWINDFSNNEWVSFEAIRSDPKTYPEFTITKPPGTFTVDDCSTNVRAIYWCTLQLRRTDSYTFTAVCLDDLTPNKEKARFSPTRFRWTIKPQGEKIYVVAG